MAAIDYSLKSNYTGTVAAQYDRKRRKRKKWRRELAVIEKISGDFYPGAAILDAPLGTGRFIPFYINRGCRIFGLDISPDMIEEARKKMIATDRVLLSLADLRHLPLRDMSVDYSVCIRLLNWVPMNTARQIIAELRRISRKDIIIGFRSERTIRFWEFTKYFLWDLVPTTRHIRVWGNLAAVFCRKSTVKIKKLFYRRDRNMMEVSAPVKWRGKTFFNLEDMTAYFFELGMEITDRFFIDALASYRRKKLRPYFIYRLRISGQGRGKVR